MRAQIFCRGRIWVGHAGNALGFAGFAGVWWVGFGGWCLVGGVWQLVFGSEVRRSAAKRAGRQMAVKSGGRLLASGVWRLAAKSGGWLRSQAQGSDGWGGGGWGG